MNNFSAFFNFSCQIHWKNSYIKLNQCLACHVHNFWSIPNFYCTFQSKWCASFNKHFVASCYTEKRFLFLFTCKNILDSADEKSILTFSCHIIFTGCLTLVFLKNYFELVMKSNFPVYKTQQRRLCRPIKFSFYHDFDSLSTLWGSGQNSMRSLSTQYLFLVCSFFSFVYREYFIPVQYSPRFTLFDRQSLYFLVCPFRVLTDMCTKFWHCIGQVIAEHPRVL